MKLSPLLLGDYGVLSVLTVLTSKLSMCVRVYSVSLIRSASFYISVACWLLQTTQISIGNIRLLKEFIKLETSDVKSNISTSLEYIEYITI